jgi:Uma2 family endonuclease
LDTTFYLSNGLGTIYAAETGFLLSRAPDTVRAPNFAFIQASRVAPEALAPGWNPIIPALVVEVVSSGDQQTEVAEKVRMWLAAGVRLVWVVFPSRRMIEQPMSGELVLTLGEQDQLDGGAVVPGFTLLIARIFG